MVFGIILLSGVVPSSGKFIIFYEPYHILTLVFRPQNREELYNLRHASARNVVERIFGVVKRRFA